MRLVIGARRSDLARLQAYQVAAALKKNHSQLEIEFRFKSSLGDLDQDTPLVTMGNKGVFTQDFHADLLNRECDLVVHSWKDLPTEPVPGTQIAATLPRADARDVLLLRQECLEAQKIRVLSSSPRRAYNLKAFLPTVWPKNEVQFQFTNVRGNIQTRVQKLMRAEGETLIVAKAALDRLLSAQGDEFAETQQILRSALKQCFWMVLPLSQNPCAAAQGALAIEVLSSRQDLLSLLKTINHGQSFSAAEEERRILAGYGGGCHQKIGVNVSVKPYGQVLSLRGQTDQNELLNKFYLERHQPLEQAKSEDEIFPLSAAMGQWFERQPLLKEDWWESLEKSEALWVARGNALPAAYEPRRDQLVWTAGVSSWQALSRRGVWVNGCADGLGEQEDEQIDLLHGKKVNWLKLTHQKSSPSTAKSVATYRIEPRKNPPNLHGRKYFFWASGSAFLRAYELYPEEIKKGHHACGPGKTHEVLKRVLQREPMIYLSWQDWRNAVLPEIASYGR